MDDKKQILHSVDYLLHLLGAETGISLEELIEKISLLNGKPVYIRAACLPASLSGFSASVRDGFVIYYDEERPPSNITCIILHELAHILKGDLNGTNPVDENFLLKKVYTARDSSELSEIACRGMTGPNNRYEQEIEFIARSLMRKLISREERAFNQNWDKWLGQ